MNKCPAVTLNTVVKQYKIMIPNSSYEYIVKWEGLHAYFYGYVSVQCTVIKSLEMLTCRECPNEELEISLYVDMDKKDKILRQKLHITFAQLVKRTRSVTFSNQ